MTVPGRWRSIGAAALLVWMAAGLSPAAAQSIGPLPAPEVNSETWVLIEVWPLEGMPHISFAAYFLDSSYEKNQSLCEAGKRGLDRDDAATEESTGRELNSYRLCLPLGQARAEGYVRAR